MIHLRSLRYDNSRTPDTFPFTLPMVRSLEEMVFKSPVTFFVGENGSGKSTLLEALAASVGSIVVGAESVQTDRTLSHARELAKQLKLTWQKRTRKGFFLRAEDFFSYAKHLAELRAEMLRELARVDEEYQGRSAAAISLAKLPFRGSIAGMDSRYGEDLDANSHGESFMKLFQSRLVPGGLYLLDEPEAPLSPMRQLAFLVLLKEMVESDCQFIIATHSPVLMAFPGATIFSFDNLPPREVEYGELEHVNLMRDFLNDPERFLRHL